MDDYGDEYYSDNSFKMCIAHINGQANENVFKHSKTTDEDETNDADPVPSNILAANILLPRYPGKVFYGAFDDSRAQKTIIVSC